MIKIIKILEWVLLALISISLVLIFFFVTGVSVYFRGLAILYVVLLLIFPHSLNGIKGIGEELKGTQIQKTLSVLFSVSVAIMLIGVVGKITHLTVGSVILHYLDFVIFSIWCLIVIYFFTNKSKIVKPLFARLFIAIGVWTLFHVVPSDWVIDFRYRNYPEYIELYNKSKSEPDNIELQKMLLEEQSKIYRSK